MWLLLENIKTQRPNQSLDHRYTKFTVLEVLGSYNYWLDTPPSIYNVFYTRLLRPASTDPLPGQVVTEVQPLGQLVDNVLKYEVEAILGQKRARRNKQQYLVK